MHINKRAILVILGILVAGLTFAQQQSLFTQYMFNPISINPGYIGRTGGLDISALGRWQWAGLEGAPNTQTLAIHAPVTNRNIGLGLQITRDEIAVSRRTNTLLGYSYKIDLGEGVLSMGLQGGFTYWKIDLTSVYTLGGDPSFQRNYANFKPNFGVGLFYYNPIFYGGFSAPLIMTNSLGADQAHQTQRRHYFINTGLVLSPNANVKVKPNALLRMVSGAPISIDYNVNVLLKELLWLGVSYRPPESISFIIELEVNQRLKVGYSHDYIIDPILSEQITSSHELLVNYSIDLEKSQITTPRYF